ncbi:MAG TPA: hypothetical protein VLA72_19145 [Anaerolineales bacterium]|nr:hypothetical protein [Anaerolineales bacterium]
MEEENRKVFKEMNTNPVQKYRWAWWTIFINFSMSLFVLPISILLFSIPAYLLYDLFQDGNIEFLDLFLLLIFSPILLFSVIAFFWYTFFPLGRLLFSYFIVTETGIEYRYWPTYGVRCKWEDVERVGKYRSLLFITYDVLYIQTAEPVGKPITMSLRKKLGLSTKYVVPLAGINGWPDGELANELRKYAPQAFDENKRE